MEPWDCPYCSLINESYQIVCSNCRSSKYRSLQYKENDIECCCFQLKVLPPKSPYCHLVTLIIITGLVFFFIK